MKRYLVINYDRNRVEDSFETEDLASAAAVDYANDSEDSEEFRVAVVIGVAKRPFPGAEYTEVKS